MTHERDIQSQIWQAMGRFSRMFRNNVGAAMVRGRLVRFGLVKGSSDLIGWTPVEITQDMVGQKVAIFTAIECKAPRGQPTPAQTYFVGRVKMDGGYAGIARSTEDALEIIGRG